MGRQSCVLWGVCVAIINPHTGWNEIQQWRSSFMENRLCLLFKSQRPCPPVNRYICIYSLYINIYKYMHIRIAQINYYRNIWHNLPRTHAFPSQMVFLLGFVSQKYFPETAFFVTEWPEDYRYFKSPEEELGCLPFLAMQSSSSEVLHYLEAPFTFPD